jgi:hypothetical protein
MTVWILALITSRWWMSMDSFGFRALNDCKKGSACMSLCQTTFKKAVHAGARGTRQLVRRTLSMVNAS